MNRVFNLFLAKKEIIGNMLVVRNITKLAG